MLAPTQVENKSFPCLARLLTRFCVVVCWTNLELICLINGKASTFVSVLGACLFPGLPAPQKSVVCLEMNAF